MNESIDGNIHFTKLKNCSLESGHIFNSYEAKPLLIRKLIPLSSLVLQNSQRRPINVKKMLKNSTKFNN